MKRVDEMSYLRFVLVWAVSNILILLACTRLSGRRDVMKTSSRENRTRVMWEEELFCFLSENCFFTFREK